MGERIRARQWTVTAPSSARRKKNGKCSSGRSTPAISIGTSTNGISGTSKITAKPIELTGARVHREKDLLICGCCGKRMTVRYHSRRVHLSPDYVCQREGIEPAEPICRHIPDSNIDEAVSAILVEAVTPVTLEVALAVQQELPSRLEEADRLRQQQVERSRDEAELARRRYLRADPGIDCSRLSRSRLECQAEDAG